ncbi:hypothetical protein IB259_11115 [Achromobacter sp. ACM04]|uniref:hypothetical protein n=1 Tax=Achromobacter sp. ACM04 TaxID=2769312 RepID=UPI00177CE1D4|nr:hypothetical protein [Achromobacter sp. ACM04]MBD9419805.1 hypothetical protein [Achromobacter sp. ACM04]
MPSGLYVKGDLGQVQIDENYRNVALIARGSVSLPAAWGSAILQVPASVVMVAFRSEKWIYVHETQLSGATIRYELRNGEVGGSAPVYWYAFGAPAGGGNSGIEVFDAATRQVFHSDFSYWNYYGFFTSQGAGQEIDITTPFVPLVVQLGVSTYISMYNEVDAYQSITYFRTIGNRVQTKNDGGISSGNWPGNYTYGEDGASLLVLNSSRIY